MKRLLLFALLSTQAFAAGTVVKNDRRQRRHEDFLRTSAPSGGYASLTFPSQRVLVLSGDADKTVGIKSKVLGGGATIYTFVSATRVA